jgi:N-acylneuraminate cytidylyltransferase/CMP-N,N'-diacetyllegionaminic acid synthase
MHLAKDETVSPPVVLHAINHFENLGEIYDYVFMLEPTSPLTEAKDLDEALNLILKNSNKFDSLVTIAESISGHPDFTFSLLEDLSINSINQIDWKVKRRQEISKLYFIEGTLYLSKISSFKKSVAFVQKKTLGMVVTREKSFEVDEELDFYLIEAVLKFRDEKLHVGN